VSGAVREARACVAAWHRDEENEKMRKKIKENRKVKIPQYRAASRYPHAMGTVWALSTFIN
jgi:hypothetical protein